MAVRDFFHNYLYGDPHKRDFTKADLPADRLHLFAHVLNIRKGKMVGLNLLYFLCWLPALAWSLLNVMQINRALALPPDEFWAALPRILLSWLALLAPLIVLTGPFNVAVSYVFHRWAEDVHSFVLSDFGRALKANWKQGLLFGLLDGLMPLVAYLSCYFYLALSARSVLFLLPLALTLIAFLIWLLAAPLVPQLISAYEQRFGRLLGNAILMTLLNLPRAVGVRLLTWAVPIALGLGLFLFPGQINWMISVALLLYAAFLLSLNKLIWASYANALGERYLNAHIEGAATNIGLRPRPSAGERDDPA